MLFLCQREYDQISELEAVHKAHFTSVRGHEATKCPPQEYTQSSNCQVKDHPTLPSSTLSWYSFSQYRLSSQRNEHFLRQRLNATLFCICFSLRLAWCKILTCSQWVLFVSLIKRFGFPHPTGTRTATASGRPVGVSSSSDRRSMRTGQVQRMVPTLKKKIRESWNFGASKDLIEL